MLTQVLTVSLPSSFPTLILSLLSALLLNKLQDQGSHPAEIGREMYLLGSAEIVLDTQITGTI